jgi:hypothetical protein
MRTRWLTAFLLTVTLIAAVAGVARAEEAWTFKAAMPSPQTAPGHAALGGLVYAVGGWDAFHLCGYLNTVTAYSPATNTWTARAPMPTAREHTGVGVWNGKLYAVGGSTGCGPLTGANEVYDPAQDT